MWTYKHIFILICFNKCYLNNNVFSHLIIVYYIHKFNPSFVLLFVCLIILFREERFYQTAFNLQTFSPSRTITLCNFYLFQAVKSILFRGLDGYFIFREIILPVHPTVQTARCLPYRSLEHFLFSNFSLK